MPTPARYDPNRDNMGHFVKGNQVSLARPGQDKLLKLRAAWLEANTPEDVMAVVQSLKDLCLTAESEDVRLKAIALFLDRCLGKVESQVNIGVEHRQVAAPSVILNDAEKKVLEKFIVDAQFEVKEPKQLEG